MKKYLKLLVGTAILSLVILSQAANAGIVRDCAGFNVGGIKFRTCQAHFHRGPWWWHRHHGWWRRGRHHRRFERCTVHWTRWGRVRRCVVH